MVYPSLQAAERFDGRVEVIDLRTISPWDQDSVLASVRKTGRCLIVHEDTWTGGFAGEIIATLADHAFASLDAPPKRLTTPDIPIPYAKELMISVLPDEDRIVSELEALLAF
jgi:2-oxoisovalerate dehydrogenase E1 component